MSEIRVEDVTYFTHPSGALLARLYRPKTGTPSAAIVSLHGGRWVQETRLTNAPIDQALAEDGALVMAIDIRMPPAARYPDCLADINVATRWLKAHAAEFGIDPRHVGGIGTSSGGHQMMLSALRPHDRRYDALALAGGQNASLAYVVLGWPVIDPLARYRYAEAGNKTPYLEAHHAYWPSVADMADGNPQLILERGESVPPLPPVLLLQGTADEALPEGMADRFAAAYKKAGGAIELVKFAGAGHTFITKQLGSPAARDAIARIKSFVRAQSQSR
jgi:acetyl esterase/lipase